MLAIDGREVIERLKVAFQVKTDTELAGVLEVSNKTISSWKSRNSIPMDVLLQACVATDKNIDYFLFGNEQKALGSASIEEFSEESFKDFRILGRSILISVLDQYADETLAFMEDDELKAKGEALGAQLLITYHNIKNARQALVDKAKLDEETFAEYAAKANQPALPYFAAGIKMRNKS